jgi:hypothetical protein
MINKYKQKAKLLKARGLIKFDLRQKLTPQRKSAITRSWNINKSEIQFEENIKDNAGPNGEYLKLTTAKRNFKAQLRRAGYLVEGNSAYINKDGFDKVAFKDGRIIRTSTGRRSEEILFKSNNVTDQLKEFSEKEINDPNTWKAVRIGNFSPMGFSSRKGRYKNTPLNERPASAQRFEDFNQLMNYITNWEPKDVENKPDTERRKLKNTLVNSMTLLTIDKAKFKKCKVCKKQKSSTYKGVCKPCREKRKNGK